MRRALSRLRWQLTVSHLIAVAFTLVCLIAAAVTIGTLALAWHGPADAEPAQTARLVAEMLGGADPAADPAATDAILRALVTGRLRLPFGPPPTAPEPARRLAGGWSLSDLTYIVIVRPSGELVASSDPAGADFAPAEQADWRALAARVVAGERDPSRLVALHPAESPAALGAAPILTGSGRDAGGQAGVVIVAVAAYSPVDRSLDLWRSLVVFGAATAAVLAAASVFAFASSSLVAFLLSRRLVGRLERLGEAAGALAGGDLGRRVEEGPPDEVGLLARRFNAMADDLGRTLAQLQAERDRVAGLLEARRQLVAGVSHELRTPVATLRGYLEAALRHEAAVAPELRDDLAIMTREVTRLQHLIDDLFTLSRAAVGQLDLRPEPTDVGAVVDRLVTTTARLAWGQRRVQVLAEIPPALPPARADAPRLEQVVSNLLGNAVRHTPPGGLVVASVAAEPAAVRIDVRDTGEGIAADDRPHLFERFYRGRGATTLGGAGLGLALAKELTAAMGGTVELTSTSTQGSCFTVRLPRA